MLPPGMWPSGCAIATPANATAAKAAMSFILSMVRFLSSLEVIICLWLDRSADQTAYKTAEERRSDFAPVLRVERVIVVVMVLRGVMPCRRRRRRGVAYNLVPRHMVPCGCCMLCIAANGSLCDLMRGCGFRLCSLGCFCPHRSRRFAAFGCVVLRSGHCRAAKCAADRESHHQFLYCLVHCRVPFNFSASLFSRLHWVRTVQ